MLALLVALLLLAVPASAQTPTSQILHRDVLVNADMWDTRPRMMAAGLGFTNIIGVAGISTNDLAGSETRVRRIGGAWNTISCASGTTPALSAYTSASTPQQVAFSFGAPVSLAAGLPVEFSWPIRPSTLDAGDFTITLSNGRRVKPAQAAVFPNAEYDERAVAVLFGKFGNRGSLYPVKTEVVHDDTPLQLVGSGGRIVSAVGMSATAKTSPYAPGRNGPRLVAAKLTRMSTRGDTAPPPFNAALPNDGVTLYGKAARYRLRVYTSGGFSPDGVRAVFPTEFGRYFRVHARVNGRDVAITRPGVDYAIGRGGRIRVLGLAELGRKAARYDDCYSEDKDNQIDIVLDGDAAAMRHITDVEIPATGRYSPFYNPGGPGNDPTPGTDYSQPGPPQRQPVTIALDDPLSVDFRP